MSDGVHDNLDPEVLQVDPSQWNTNSTDMIESKRRFAETLALQLIQETVLEDKRVNNGDYSFQPVD